MLQLTFEEYKEFNSKTELTEEDFVDIRYDEYLDILECIAKDGDLEVLTEGLFDRVKGFTGKLKAAFTQFKEDLKEIAEQFKMSITDLVIAFKNRNLFAILKAFGFKLKLVLKAINSATALLRKGLMAVFEEIAQTGIFQKIEKGIVKVDDLLKKYPILKRLTGIAVAGLLIYIWLNMTFIGDLDYDFNFSAIFQALSGNYTLHAIFGGGAGIMLATLFATGSVVSAPWLGTTAANLILALVYTAYVGMRGRGNQIANALRSRIRTQKFSA